MNLSKRIDLLISISLILAIFTVYWQLSTHNFVIIDDNAYVTNNLHVKKGLSVQNIKWSFTTFSAEFWHPITWLSLMLDTQLFGVNPGGYLLTNLLIHTLNSILLFISFRLMTGGAWQSAFVAALFALHPLHVESVAWIAMRKDVLSTFFAFLTLLSYIWYVKSPDCLKYGLIIFLFFLGLSAKPMLVTLPFVFILIDFWPLERLRFSTGHAANTLSVKSSFLEKIPLVTIALAMSVTTYFAQKAGGGLVSLESIPFLNRTANALVSYGVYLKKMIWPTQLSVFYPYTQDLPVAHVILSLIVLAIISYSAVACYKYQPYFIFGWLWYLGTLLPVIGLVKIGDFAIADRYTYFPMIGIFIVIAWGIPSLFGYWKYRKVVLGSVGLFILMLLSITSYKQIGYWKDSTTLFKHAIYVTENNYLAHWSLGHALSGEGKMGAAIEHFKEAVHIKPKRVDFHNDLGRALIYNGMFEESVSYLEQAIMLKPSYPNAHYNLGIAITALGQYDKAVDSFYEALKLNRNSIKVKDTEKPTETVSSYEQVLLSENNGLAGQTIRQYIETLRLNPDFLQVRHDLARLYVHTGKDKAALSLFKIKTSTDWLKKAAANGYKRWSLVGKW